MKSMMTARRQAVLLISCLFLGALGPTASQANLALGVGAPKHVYLLSEPLFVTVTIWNSGSEEAQILRAFHPGMGILSFEVTRPDGEKHTYVPWLHFEIDPTSLPSVVLARDSK